MSDLIGVFHNDKNLEYLIKYLDENYSNINSVMLELGPNFKKLKEGRRKYFNGKLYDFFEILSDYFEKRGIEIIAGDANGNIIVPETFDLRIFKILVEKEKRRYPFEEYILLLKSNFLGIFNNLSSKKRNQRDKGMLEVYLEKKPDLIIVGDYHARYLKKNNIDLNYILFRGNSWRENLISYFYQNSKYKPEKTIIIST